MKKQFQGDNSSSPVLEPNTYLTTAGNKAILFKCGEEMNVTQGFCDDIPNGFALAIYNIPTNANGEVSEIVILAGIIQLQP